jgi:hypothetical protein
MREICSSIGFDIFELLIIDKGAGEHARYKKHRLYRIAKRSATECTAILDIGQTDLAIIGVHLREENYCYGSMIPC